MWYSIGQGWGVTCRAILRQKRRYTFPDVGAQKRGLLEVPQSWKLLDLLLLGLGQQQLEDVHYLFLNIVIKQIKIRDQLFLKSIYLDRLSFSEVHSILLWTATQFKKDVIKRTCIKIFHFLWITFLIISIPLLSSSRSLRTRLVRSLRSNEELNNFLSGRVFLAVRYGSMDCHKWTRPIFILRTSAFIRIFCRGLSHSRKIVLLFWHIISAFPES